jgi:hypothetical protein
MTERSLLRIGLFTVPGTTVHDLLLLGLFYHAAKGDLAFLDYVNTECFVIIPKPSTKIYCLGPALMT